MEKKVNRMTVKTNELSAEDSECIDRLVEGYTDKSIFLPAAGYRDRSKLNNGGEQGHYWSSTLDLDYDYAGVAYHLFFRSTGYGTGTTDRTFGRTIRPVVLISSINK